MLGFVFATENEYKTFRLNVTDAQEKTLKMGQIIGCGKIQGRDLCYALSGCGKVNAAMVTEALIEKYKPEAIVNIGLAGSVGLKPDTYYVYRCLQGDVDLKFLKSDTLDGSDTFQCSEKAMKLFPKMKTANLITTDKFITEEAKDTEKRFGKCLVDMEGAAICWVCFANDVDYFGIKIVSDTCDENEYKDSTVSLERSPAEIAIEFIKKF